MALVRVPIRCEGSEAALQRRVPQRSRKGSKPFRCGWPLRLVASVTHEERREEGKSLPKEK